MTKTFKKTRLALLTGLTLSASLLSSAAFAEFSGEVSLTNDYRFRGVSQTAGDVALQAGVDWSADNGFFVGAWGSNVDFDEEGYEGPELEIDVYVGYWGEISDDASWDVTLYRYNYPGDSDLDYLEASVGFDFYGARAAYWYTNDYSGTDLDLHYVDLNYSWGFAENWSLDFHYGYNFGDALDDGEGFDSYSDYSVGISTEFNGFGISLAYLDTDLSGDQEVEDGVYKTKATALLALSYSF
ncbi:TorF family putative porin [Shewanella gaetbuli]|uniref:TorF family putative porin n=1 Tax=Shewanella gaetbuli TaxID=220752 RepID=A0A9X1ZGY0_9GAMM|nr:TorF family putative porin [Shewanella gaetbuli]